MGVHSISNVNPVRKVLQLIRVGGGGGGDHASRHNSQKLDELCAWCNQWIENEVVIPCKPSGEPVRTSPCRDLPIHRECERTSLHDYYGKTLMLSMMGTVFYDTPIGNS